MTEFKGIKKDILIENGISRRVIYIKVDRWMDG